MAQDLPTAQQAVGAERQIEEEQAVKRQRRNEVRRQTLEYLGNLLCEVPDVDGGLYENPSGEPMTNDESDYASAIAVQEGMRLIDRAKRSKT